MEQWVALLRGINVGGVSIKSKELGEHFRGRGYADVRTVLATGNVLFAEPGTAAEELRARLESELSEGFGYEARVVLEPRHRMAALVAAYPYDESDSHHAYVVFSSDAAALTRLVDDAAGRGIAIDAGDAGGPDASTAQATPGSAPLSLAEDEERICLGPGVVFWACPRGSSTSTPFSQLTAAARHKPSLTTRNLNTVRKLV